VARHRGGRAVVAIATRRSANYHESGNRVTRCTGLPSSLSVRTWRAMQPADLVPKAFSTVGIPAARQVELWETHNATALIGLDVRASEPLVATELNVRLPGVDLARVSGSAHMVRRTRKVIERSPADAIAVYLTLRGDAWFETADRTYALGPGNVLVSETDKPFARGFSRGLDELVVKVDRAALPEVPRLSGPVVVPLRGDTSDQYAQALTRITGRATRTCQPLPADERTVLDLVAALAAGGATAPATAHRAAARSYIEEHLTDPSLGAEEVAAAIGISERQLSRVFAADGVPIPRHILSRRLDLAYSMLSSSAGSQNAETVADIAARCGFTSATYFSHTFRQHFGHRASDIGGRRRA
jgi:AraC-like DNA-binding protein